MMKKDKQLQEAVRRASDWLQRISEATVTTNVGLLAGDVSRAAKAKQCTGDYVSDLVGALQDLATFATETAELLDALRVQLDEESMKALRVAQAEEGAARALRVICDSMR